MTAGGAGTADRLAGAPVAGGPAVTKPVWGHSLGAGADAFPAPFLPGARRRSPPASASPSTARPTSSRCPSSALPTSAGGRSPRCVLPGCPLEGGFRPPGASTFAVQGGGPGTRIPVRCSGVPSRTVVVPASPPASAWAWGVPGAERQGFPERKCDWPRGARPPRPALCVSQVQFRAAASRGAQVGSALLAQWPLNRRLVSQRSGDLFSGAGASFCGLGQGTCRSLRFPTGRGAGWLGSAFFQTRAPQGVGAASGQKVLRARWSSGTGKPRFSGFRCGPSQSLCLSVPRLDLPEGSVSWRIFKRNCLESHSFFAFSNS